MPSERTRNTIVGLTIIIALGVLMWGIFVLGLLPNFTHVKPYAITLYAENANGAGAGAKVDLNGVAIGQARSVMLVERNHKIVAQVIIDVDGNSQIPQSAVAILGRPQAGIGNPFISISAPSSEPPMVPHDGTGVLEARAGDTSLIPQAIIDRFSSLQSDMSTLAHQLSVVAADMHALLKTDAADIDGPTTQPGNVSTMIARLNRAVASIQSLVGDPSLQKNVRTVMQNLADSSGQLKETLQSVDKTLAAAGATVSSYNAAATQATATLTVTQAQIYKVTEKLAGLVDDLDKTTRQLASGNGTAGKLINDPRLYDGLAGLAESLKATTDDLDFLIKKWKDEGLGLHLK